MYVCMYIMYLGERSYDIHLFCRKVSLPTFSATFILCFTIIVFRNYNFQIQLPEELLLELHNSAWFGFTNNY